MSGETARTGEVTAIDAVVHGRVQGVGFRETTLEHARRLGVLGWVRNEDDGTVRLHAEGDPGALRELRTFMSEGPRASRVEHLDWRTAAVEGHEQFAVRGVPAGVFVVQQHAATARHFDLRLEVDGVMRSWAVPKGPSMDPAVRRLAVEVADHDLAHNAFEGRTPNGAVLVWDRGHYEQGGRRPWPQAMAAGPRPRTRGLRPSRREAPRRLRPSTDPGHRPQGAVAPAQAA